MSCKMSRGSDLLSETFRDWRVIYYNDGTMCIGIRDQHSITVLSPHSTGHIVDNNFMQGGESLVSSTYSFCGFVLALHWLSFRDLAFIRQTY